MTLKIQYFSTRGNVKAYRRHSEGKALLRTERHAKAISQRRIQALRGKTSTSSLIRRTRQLQLSASLTSLNSHPIPKVETTETTPIGLPVPENYSKVKILTSSDLKRGGRLIIVGDVHGCYEQFCELLEKCSFDKDKDNLIMAGDLVNKGPDSLKVLKKAMKLKAFVVRGNHEDNALEAYYKHCRGEEISEKYDWVKNLKKKHVAFIESLPFAFKIPSHKLIVVHAGLVPGTDLQKQDMFAMYRMRDLRKSNFQKPWIPLERGIEESIPWASEWKGPEHVIFGHDSSRRLQYHPFATGIDTGAVQGDQLSACIFPPEEKIPNRTGPAFRENLGMVLCSVDVPGPQKITFPKPVGELAAKLVSQFTLADNQSIEMYSSL